MIKAITLAAALAMTSLMLSGCGESDRDRAMKSGSASSGDQLRQRVRDQGDR